MITNAALIHQDATRRFLNAFDRSDKVPWTKLALSKTPAPSNPVTGLPYFWSNAFLLSLEPFESPWWLTLTQARQAGFQPKNNAQPVWVHFWSWESGSPELAAYPVYNLEQIPKMPEPERPAPKTNKFHTTKATVIEALKNFSPPLGLSHQPHMMPIYYAPADHAWMNLIEDHGNQEGSYWRSYLTLHLKATGHPSRLNRQHPLVSQETRHTAENLVVDLALVLFINNHGLEEVGKSACEHARTKLQIYRAYLAANPQNTIHAGQAAEHAYLCLHGNLPTGSAALSYPNQIKEAQKTDTTNPTSPSGCANPTGEHQ